MLSVQEIKGSVEHPDISDRVNEFLDKLTKLSEDQGVDVEVFDIKYTVSHDIETGTNISSALIIFFVKAED